MLAGVAGEGVAQHALKIGDEFHVAASDLVEELRGSADICRVGQRP